MPLETQLSNKGLRNTLTALVVSAGIGISGYGMYNAGKKSGIREGHEEMRVAIIRKVSAERDSYYSKPEFFHPTTMEESKTYGEGLALARATDYFLNDSDQIINENK